MTVLRPLAKSITLMPVPASALSLLAISTGNIAMSSTQVPISELQPASLARVAVLVPAWDPGCSLISLVHSLLQRGFGAVILIDDGSSSSSAKIFAELQPLDRVHLLCNAINLGKGRALKSGIDYFLNKLPKFDILITADDDGQHAPNDVARVAQIALQTSGKVVFGSRCFTKLIPLRSRIGNGLTRHIFAFVTGIKLADTQTGLRAFPRSMLPSLAVLQGERYEYEMNVLAYLCRTGSKPLEVPIEAIYIEGNKSSRFNPIRDSISIYLMLARVLCRPSSS
jgi:glycosyltransferase involved in cell wall biosynthesis